MKAISVNDNQTIESYKKQIQEYCDELEFISQQPSCSKEDRRKYVSSINNLKSFLFRDISKAFCEHIVAEINETVSLINETERKLNITYMSKDDKINYIVTRVANIIGKDNILTVLIDKYKRKINGDINNFPDNCGITDEDRLILCNSFAQNPVASYCSGYHFSINDANKIIQDCNFRFQGKLDTSEFKEYFIYLKWFFKLVNQMTMENPKYCKIKGQKFEYDSLFQRCVVSVYALTVSSKIQLNVSDFILSAKDYKEMPEEWEKLKSKANILSNNKDTVSSDGVLTALQEVLQRFRMGVQVFQGDFNWLVGYCIKVNPSSDKEIDVALTRFMALLCANRKDERILSDDLYVKHFIENTQNQLLTEVLVKLAKGESIKSNGTLRLT